MARIRLTQEKTVKSIPNCIKMQLVLKGWKQKDLADRLNISEGTLSHTLSNPETITMGRMEQIADLFGCQISELYSDRRVRA